MMKINAEKIHTISVINVDVLHETNIIMQPLFQFLRSH